LREGFFGAAFFGLGGAPAFFFTEGARLVARVVVAGKRAAISDSRFAAALSWMPAIIASSINRGIAEAIASFASSPPSSVSASQLLQKRNALCE
jgi:hypothetical protein